MVVSPAQNATNADRLAISRAIALRKEVAKVTMLAALVDAAAVDSKVVEAEASVVVAVDLADRPNATHAADMDT